MSFFAVLFALALEQVRPLPRGNRIHDALVSWVNWTGRNLDAGRPHHAAVVWGVSVVGPALAIVIAYAAVLHFSLILALLFDIGVLYLTLGFRQFSHHFTDIREALERGDEAGARQMLADWHHLDTSASWIQFPRGSGRNCSITSAKRTAKKLIGRDDSQRHALGSARLSAPGSRTGCAASPPSRPR